MPIRLARLLGMLTKDNRIIFPSQQDKGIYSQYNLVKWKPLLEVDFNVSNRCCNVMKKQPAHEFAKRTGKKAITAQMAVESRLRRTQWLQHGCNAFDSKVPISNPMSFWTEQDVLQYIYENDVEIAEPYGKVVCNDEIFETTGIDRTGCIFCGFGSHLNNDQRFVMLSQTHPKQYNFCMQGGEFVDGVWKANKNGLGMKYVIDELNSIYGDDFIKY